MNSILFLSQDGFFYLPRRLGGAVSSLIMEVMPRKYYFPNDEATGATNERKTSERSERRSV